MKISFGVLGLYFKSSFYSILILINIFFVLLDPFFCTLNQVENILHFSMVFAWSAHIGILTKYWLPWTIGKSQL